MKRIDDLCSSHQREPAEGHRCATCARLRMERKIVRKIAQAMIAAGYRITVDNGEEIEVRGSRILNEILEASFQTDEERFHAYGPDGKRVGMVYFVYGNSGYDVVNDYSMSLEELMKPIDAYCDELDLKTNA